MRAELLKGWLAAARREEKEREARTKDGGDREEEQAAQTEAEGHWGRVVEIVQTPYPSKIPRHLDLSKASYTLVRSRKIT